MCAKYIHSTFYFGLKWHVYDTIHEVWNTVTWKKELILCLLECSGLDSNCYQAAKIRYVSHSSCLWEKLLCLNFKIFDLSYHVLTYSCQRTNFSQLYPEQLLRRRIHVFMQQHSQCNWFVFAGIWVCTLLCKLDLNLLLFGVTRSVLRPRSMFSCEEDAG
jgi:hypothetical protein